MRTILDYLEKNAERFPDKIAFADQNREISFSELVTLGQKLGTKITKHGQLNQPVVIFLEKSVEAIIALVGTLYSGNHYVFIDTTMPAERFIKIRETLKEPLVISRNKEGSKLDCEYIDVENLTKIQVEAEKLVKIREEIVDTNPMYILFTSGSTGTPKGVVVSHRACLAYLDWLESEFDYNEKTVFGNQTQLYFSMSLSDVIATLKVGATAVLIPKMYFAFPIKLIEMLNKYSVNTIYWVPSALGLIRKLDVLEAAKINHLEKILFAGEPMPVKTLKYWQKYYKGQLFANLFGPSETVDICTFYKVDRTFSETESLPIGKICQNLSGYILDENNQPSDEGELCISGSFLASGYYNDFNKTSQTFIQNPLNQQYLETIYRTGDIVRKNERGELEFITRKDFQIKRHGYRIEIGEIETAITAFDKVDAAGVIYSEQTDLLVAFYEGDATEQEVLEWMKTKLQNYMVPDKIEKVARMPYNANGKIDRKKLKEELENGKN